MEPIRIQQRSGWGRALSLLYPLLGFGFMTGVPIFPLLLRLGFAALTTYFLALILWRRMGNEEVALSGGRLVVTRRLFGVPFRRNAITVSDVSDVTALDHESRPDAMFAVRAMTGPGYLEIVGRNGARV